MIILELLEGIYQKTINKVKVEAIELGLVYIFNEVTYGIKVIYDEVDTPSADVCFSKITITHSVYWVDHFKGLFESFPEHRKVVPMI